MTETANPSGHLALGRFGEELASTYLKRNGYRLVAANFKLPIGRNCRGASIQAELDLVAYDHTTLCFIEVKTRATNTFAAPEANVDLRKQRQIARAARVYRRIFGLQECPYRFDVVSIVIADAATGRPHIELLQNYFRQEKQDYHDKY